ncbi:AcrR family transcriptional regulator [Salirhabdus euzebyi]|uniref:AcrR family transcriptional regulator n=1 Tax=Salirhabdus euzebyi TaxID=394506 RepID=A0A841QAX8_9BACI|nr:TetR/AcrR family transcriptional regulator [Salirhabdus euzebyi]MBB6455367.1 AcrR family transcriptional regulator [Salirhabdus euzebyi]
MEEEDLIDELMGAAEKDLTPKQAKILQAAVEIFAEKGYASTSTSEIAKRAGVAEGTIFRHYKTKKELLISIVSPIMLKFAVPFFADKFLNDVFKEENTENLDQLIKKLIYNRYYFVKKNIPLVKILLQEMAFHAELQDKFKQMFVEKVLPRFKEVVEKFKVAEQIKDYPTETIIRLTMTTIIGFLVTRFLIIPDYNWDDEQEIEYTIEFIRNGLKNT